MSLPIDVTEKTVMVSLFDYQALMQSAFDQVCDKADWKGPIDCIVPWHAVHLYLEAVKFMTAAEVTFERCSDAQGNPAMRVRSVGYRAGPAGP